MKWLEYGDSQHWVYTAKEPYLADCRETIMVWLIENKWWVLERLVILPVQCNYDVTNK